MYRFFLMTLIYSVLTNFTSKAQEEGNWDVYMAQYEDGPGSTMLNMDLINKAPKAGLPYVLITGVKFENCREDGFPNKDEFEKLYKVSDNIVKMLKKYIAFESVGTFTYQCERLDYIYLSDTNSIRKRLTELYESEFNDYEYYINLKQDDLWKAYTEFLYPNEETLEYMFNQKVIFQLQQAGDNLSKERQVDHWLYFSEKSERELFLNFVEDLGFKMESQENIKNSDLPYQLHISRTDFVYPESINKITLELKKKARELNGDYDGWETFVVTE